MKWTSCTSLAVALAIMVCVAAAPLQRARPTTVTPPPPCPIGEPHGSAPTGSIICTNTDGQYVKLDFDKGLGAAVNIKGESVNTNGTLVAKL